MSLFNFPLDTNNCSITIQSFGYGSKDLQLLWIKGKHVLLDSIVDLLIELKISMFNYLIIFQPKYV